MPTHASRMQELEEYRRNETAKLAFGRSTIVQRVLAENPLRIYPDHLLNDYLRKGPPVDPKMFHPPCQYVVMYGGGDPLVCRDDRFAMCFAWCLVEIRKTYMRRTGMKESDLDNLVLEYRKWWGIVSLHDDAVRQYPSSLMVFDFWREHVLHQINYQNFGHNVGRHGALTIDVSDDREELFRKNTLPAYRMIYGPRNFPSSLWDGANIS